MTEGSDANLGVTFGAGVRAARERLGWTQQQLSDRLLEHDLRMDTSAITRVESGSRDVRLSEAARIATALGATLDQLVPQPPDPQKKFDRTFAEVIERVEAVQLAVVGLSTYLLMIARILDDNPRMLTSMVFPGDRVPASTEDYFLCLAEGFSTAKPKWQMASDRKMRDLIVGVAVAAAKAAFGAEGDALDGAET